MVRTVLEECNVLCVKVKLATSRLNIWFTSIILATTDIINYRKLQGGSLYAPKTEKDHIDIVTAWLFDIWPTMIAGCTYLWTWHLILYGL